MSIDATSLAWDLPQSDVWAAWRSWQLADPALDSPFLHPSFAMLVARRQPGTRIAVLARDGCPVALLPHRLVTRSRGKPLAAGLSDVQAVIAEPGHRVDLRALLGAAELDLWSFDHLLATQGPILEALPSAHETAVSPVIDLRDGVAAWRADRRGSGSLLQTIDRKTRKLSREVGELRLILHCRDHDQLERLLLLKSAQYRRTGRRDRFADAAVRGLVHDLLDLDDEGCAGLHTVLLAGDRPVASHFGLRSRQTLAWWFPTYDPAFAAWSPGMVLLLALVRAAADDGILRVDLGRGDEPYKRAFANLEIGLLQGSVATQWRALQMHRARTWPFRRAQRYVLASAVLRPRARHVLRLAGTVREALPQRSR